MSQREHPQPTPSPMPPPIPPQPEQPDDDDGADDDWFAIRSRTGGPTLAWCADGGMRGAPIPI